MEKKSKSTLIKFCLILGILTIVMLVFFSTYYFSINNSFKTYENNINTIVSSINKINDNVSSLYTGSEQNTKVMINELPGKIQLLNDIKNKLSNIDPSEKYKKSYDYLSKGLNYNISTYNYLLNILKDPASKNYESQIANLKDSYKKCEEYYSLFSMNKTSIIIPNNLNTLVNHSINYVYDCMRKERDKEISQNQVLEFSGKLEEVYSQFNTLKTDYSLDLERVRKNISTYDELEATLDKDLSKIKDLKKTFYEISIPENKMEIYNSMKTLIDSYTDYVENFKYTLSIEKVKIANKDINKDELNSLYDHANNKLSDVNLNYDNFMNLYKEFKKSIY